jgi:diguanylate cyclase (GGDEF)-like protein
MESDYLTAPMVSKKPPRTDTLILVAGAVLLGALAWAAVTWGEFGIARPFVNALVFAGLAGYALVAAVASHRMSVNIEKKLRLDLLVHNMELENMAMRDDLTQLFNRRYFFERLERELESARSMNRPLAVIMLDLDGLKAVNDSCGHRAGDEVLAGFGRFLLSQTRASDVPARIGGDEFAVILPETTQAAAEVMMERLQKALANTDLLEDESVSMRLTVSVGISGFPWGGDDADAIVQSADASMYANKRARKRAAPKGRALPAAPTSAAGPADAETAPAALTPRS